MPNHARDLLRWFTGNAMRLYIDRLCEEVTRVESIDIDETSFFVSLFDWDFEMILSHTF